MGKIFDIDFRKGTLIDSVNDLIGTVGNNAFFIKSEKGNGVRFDTNDYVSYPLSFSGTEISYDIWFIPKKENTYSSQHLVCMTNYTNRVSYSSSSGIVTFSSAGSGASGAPSLLTVTFDEPNHLHVHVKNNGAGYDATYLLNGITETVNEPAYNISASTAILYIGRWDAALNFGMKGDVYRVIVYNSELTSEERAKLYQEFLRATPITKAIR